MKRRSNRFLTWAIAISLAAHAVVIYWAQDMHISHAEPAPTPSVIRLDEPRPTPTPPAVIVTPKPVVPAHPQPTTRHRPPSPLISHNKPGATVGDYPPGPVTPTQPPAPSCTAPDIAARVVNTATVDTPEAAQEQGATGTSQVEVSIDPGGNVTDTSIYRSSGNSSLDNAALRAARQSTYKANVHDCEAVAGSYLFTVDFQ